VRRGKYPVILYLGDFDASGVLIDQSLMKHLNYFKIDPGMKADGQKIAEITVAQCVEFVRVAILRSQIKEFNLPTRPPKPSTHSAGWGETECVEIDTLSGAQIRGLLEEHISGYIDAGEWKRLQAIEEAEKATLAQLAIRYREESGGRG
jgi:hypothetical protein